MNKLLAFCLLLLALGVFSCSGDRLYENFIPLTDSSGWHQTDSLQFELDEIIPSGKKTLLAIRYTESYPFSNFYVRIIERDSTEQLIENKLINMPLFDSKTGEPLGKGFGSTYTKYDTLPFTFQEKTRKVILLQYMRQEILPGIEAAGIKILP